jgi:putative acetyltransferase
MVAYAGLLAVGCGALRPLDEMTAEIRRMYVRRDHRRQGVASTILRHLLSRAKHLGYERVSLETGHKQGAAMRLYESFGFVQIPPFGDYANDPTSVCYQREVDVEFNR